MVACSGDDFFEQDRPAHERIAAVADAGLDGQVQVVGFAGQARHLGGCLGDVQDQHAPAARDIVMVGHEALPRVPGPRRGDVACGGRFLCSGRVRRVGRGPGEGTSRAQGNAQRCAVMTVGERCLGWSAGRWERRRRLAGRRSHFYDI